MPKYDRERFDPPAPVVTVLVEHPESGARVDGVAMLLDSGADVTLLPRTVVDLLGIKPLDEQYRLLSFDDRVSDADAVRARLIFLKTRFRGTFLVVEGDVGVLGRNVLNSVRILLDGPAQSWEALQASS